MRLRSLLFVPGDRPQRMEKAKTSGADALILDLEDSVAPSRKEDARKFVADFLCRTKGECIRFVRINPLSGGWASGDLEAVIPCAPDGIVLPKCDGAHSVRALDECLSRLGDRFPPVLPIATETPRSVFQLGSYGEVGGRLAGLTWGVEDLSTAVGAQSARESDGTLSEPYRFVRTLALLGARAADVAAIETVFPALNDAAGLDRYARQGWRDGFTGMMAIHPDQVAVINSAFTPTPEALEHARAVVALFEANPGAGVLALDGKMVDAPHLKQAMRLLNARDSGVE